MFKTGTWEVNSLATGRCGRDFGNTILAAIIQNNSLALAVNFKGEYQRPLLMIS